MSENRRVLKVLCLFSRAAWLHKMSPVRRHATEAIARREDVHLVLSGPGWPDYDAARPVQENLQRLLPDADVVLWYKPLGGEGGPPLVDPRGLKTPACMQFNEAWWPRRRAMKEVAASGTQLVVCHHASDLPQFSAYQGHRPYVVHIPLCAERAIFAAAARPFEQRDIPVLLTGFIHRRTYPLRARFERLIRQGRIPGVVRPHPAYALPSEIEVRRQVLDYADQLGRAKIVLVDGSFFRYPLAKYTEAAMAGACVLGDLPELPPPGFRSLLVEVDPRASDRDLVRQVHHWLADEPAMAEQARRGQQAALAHFTQEAYAARWVQAVCELLGIDLPAGAATCRQAA